MKHFLARISHFLRDDDGATLVAYTVLGLAIVLIVLTVLAFIGQRAAVEFQ